jgi:hypothetical protein
MDVTCLGLSGCKAEQADIICKCVGGRRIDSPHVHCSQLSPDQLSPLHHFAHLLYPACLIFLRNVVHSVCVCVGLYD